MRAARLRTCRMPRPVSRILSPFFQALGDHIDHLGQHLVGLRLGTSCVSESPSAILRNVSTEPAPPAEALLTAFFVGAFAGVLALVFVVALLVAGFAALVDAFAAALGAAAFLDGTLVTVLAIRDSSRVISGSMKIRTSRGFNL
jgi:hypothetical protein